MNQKMNVFVTGATGFLGGHLVETLVRQGHKVKTVARPSADLSRLAHPAIEVRHGELRDQRIIESAMQGCDVAYHLAATTSRTGKSRAACFVTNVDYTKHIAEAVRRAGVKRLVFCSTAAVYGVVDHPPVDEESPTKQDSPYAESKLAAERLMAAEHETNGLPVVIARFPGVLGRRSLSWIGLFRAIASGHFHLIGPGTNHTHTCHVDDVVQGLQLCGTIAGIEGRTYNLAAERAIPIREFVELIAKEVGSDISSVRLPTLPYRMFCRLTRWSYHNLRRELPWAHKYELFISDKVMSIAKAQRELGFAPRVPLIAGVRDTLGWYREQGML
jgi:nucleoside-diphosphate-sugar epimerase